MANIDTTDIIGDSTETALTSEGFSPSADAAKIADQYSNNNRGSFGSDVSGFSSSVSTSRPDWVQGVPAQTLPETPAIDFVAIRDRAMQVIGELPARAKENPWIAAGVVGFGALIAGYALGRALRTEDRFVSSSMVSGPRESDRFEGFYE